MRLLRYARNGIEPLVVLLVIAVLHHFGLAGPAPVWVPAIPLLAGAVYQQPEVQLWLSGRDLRDRVAARITGHMMLTTALAYILGWGPLLAVAHFHILSMHLEWSGSRAWRPGALASVASLGIGQLCVAMGLYSYLPLPEIHGVAAMVAIGTATTCRVLGRAVARRERAEAAVGARDERFRVLVQDSSDLIAIAGPDTGLTYVSPAAERVLGIEPDRLLGQRLWQRIHPDDIAGAQELLGRVLAGDETNEERGEFRIRDAGGQWRWFEVSSRNLLDNPAVQGVVGHYRDVTERRAAQDEVAYAATHDALTGLVNAQTFMLELEAALATPARIALLFVDLDGFKQVNDSLGHEAGDELLALVARLIRRSTMASDVVGRLGGDEFGVILTRVGGTDVAEAVAARLVAAIERDMHVAGHTVRVGCSVGVAVSGPEPIQARALLRSADLAMYAEKRARKASAGRPA
ncbi:diguanylate cyclase domain-containing protein [Dactylosporangium sp. CS-047395]|uniref:diguanylate cyclase domain-containing protein n=1 Tax=Dactylosporangium sp. CS-047395 TaxID=3239936 RepID=UPI003D8D9032